MNIISSLIPLNLSVFAEEGLPVRLLLAMLDKFGQVVVFQSVILISDDVEDEGLAVPVVVSLLLGLRKPLLWRDEPLIVAHLIVALDRLRREGFYFLEGLGAG